MTALLRPARQEDAEAVLAVMVARDVADIGRPDCSLEDVAGDWAMPGMDLAADTLVAQEPDGTIVGYAVIDARATMVLVHPDAEGRGVGTALREAMEARALARGETARQPVFAGSSGAAHLAAAGYARRTVHQRMRADLLAVPDPEGGRARPLDLGGEAAAAHAVVEAAFGEVDGSVIEPSAEWTARVASRSDPELLLGIDDGGRLAAVGVGERWDEGVGYVAQLAVAPAARGRGHGRELLLELFVAFRAQGLATAELSVQSANAPALGLYVSAGMAPDIRQEVWER